MASDRFDDALVVGAGFAGATAARSLAEAGWRVRVIDKRPHIAGNAFDEFDVTLLDLSGGGAMVSSSQMMEVESRGLLDFQLGENRMEGLRFVMLRSGRAQRGGTGHVCHLCFESIDVQTQERIMRYVFERQRAGRITG